MRKILSLLIGLLVGAGIGALLVMLFAPATGEKFRNALREGVRETMDEARAAAQKRQLELTVELQRRQGKIPPPLAERVPVNAPSLPDRIGSAKS